MRLSAKRRVLTGSILMILGLLPWLATLAGTSAGRVIDIRLDPASREIQGSLVLSLPEGGDFRLLSGLEASAADRAGEPVEVTALDAGRFEIAPRPDDPMVVIRWRGRLPEEANDSRLVVSPEGTLLPPGSAWYPISPTPQADALTLSVRVPRGQRALGTGSLVSTRVEEAWVEERFTHPHTAEVEIAAGPWTEQSRDVEGARIRTLFPESLDAAFADTYLEHAARYLEMFQRRLGPYPFESFTMAASPAPVGLAFPGFTLFGERVIPLPFIPRTSLAHELMHAWWGNGVRVDQGQGNWSEALTTYLADYALDAQRGEARETRRRWLTDLAALRSDQELPLIDFRGGSDPTARLIGYHHGAMIFHMLRRRIGDEAFDAGLRRLVDERMHRAAGWDDLRIAFETTSGEELATFFEAWLTRPGRPELRLGDVTLAETGEGFRISGALSQYGDAAPWPLDVPLLVTTSGNGLVTTQVRLDVNRGEFSIDTEQRPSTLSVDPDYHLLRHLTNAAPIWRQLSLDPRTRLLPLDETLIPLGREALGEQVPILEETPSAVEGPLMVIGSTSAVAAWRERQTTLPSPPRDLADAGHARFWTLPETRIGLLSADDRRGLERLSQILSHHGHRSYVVLDAEGNTLEADVWPVDDDPLRVEFTP